jgi:hypothetical protein
VTSEEAAQVKGSPSLEYPGGPQVQSLRSGARSVCPQVSGLHPFLNCLVIKSGLPGRVRVGRDECATIAHYTGGLLARMGSPWMCHWSVGAARGDGEWHPSPRCDRREDQTALTARRKGGVEKRQGEPVAEDPRNQVPAETTAARPGFKTGTATQFCRETLERS